MNLAADLCRRYSALILGGSVFLGVLFPSLATLLSPLLMPSVFVLVAFALLAIRPAELARAMTRARLLGTVSLWQLGAFPLLMAATLWLAPVPEYLWTSLLVSACASPIFSSPAFARIVGLDAALATAVVVTTTVLMPVSLLVYSEVLTLALQLDLSEYAWRVGVFLLLPFLLSLWLRRYEGAGWFQRLESRLDLLTVAALVVFAIAVMNGVTASLQADPGRVLAFLAAAFGVNLYAQATTWLVFIGAGRETAWTVALTAGFRNMALVLAITGTMLGSDFLIFVAVAQIPMYLLPLIMKPVYTRFATTSTPRRHEVG